MGSFSAKKRNLFNMVREVLTINVGQCGIQMGSTIWEQYCAEHGITAKGDNPDTSDDGTFQCFFEETGAGQFVPRNLMVDLEPNVIDDVKNSKFSAIYHPARIWAFWRRITWMCCLSRPRMRRRRPILRQTGEERVDFSDVASARPFSFSGF